MLKKEMQEWKGKWIEPVQAPINEEPVFTLQEMFSGKILPQLPVEERLHPVKLLKRTFALDPEKEIVRATLRMTAHGIYSAKINGRKVTDALFTPDYTSYGKYLQVQEYEITGLLQERNVWSVDLADGWYGGRVSVNGGSAQFGNTLGILGEITISYADGTSEIIGTDEQFVSTTGKYIYSDIFIGEKQDLRLDADDWETNFDCSGADNVKIADYPFDNLVPQKGAYVKAQEELAPIAIWKEGEAYIIDFGQVIAGRVRLGITLEAGQEIVLEHSETLNEDGLFFNNIVGRNKDQRDVYVGRGQQETLEPDFTFHGFRYARLSGYDGALEKADLKAIVLHTDMQKTGSLRTDNPKVNQLLHNIEWSQKGNMLSIPTDCPQRERVGWTGDMQVFAPTATFFMDVQDFISRWLDNVRADQTDEGEVLDYSPTPSDYFNLPSLTGTLSSAGWGDAVILVPWTLYQRYGNAEILAENYAAMVKWHAFSKRSAAGDKEGSARYLWDTKFHFGDWMFPSYMIGPDFKGPIATSEATKEIFGTAFLAHSSTLLAEIAEILGNEAEALEYRSYADSVKRAFEQAYWQNGRLTSDLQGCYVIAVAFGLLSGTAEQQAVKRLAELIVANGKRLDTGFLAVPYLLDVLVDNGYVDLAKQVFLQEECPSWLYEVNHGATTIWESWAGIQPDGKVGDLSFNHYAFGCVGDWMVRKIAGLQVKEPGFKAFCIAPNTDLGITAFELSYRSVHGLIEIRLAEGILMVTVPENTTAFVKLPTETTEIAVTAGIHTFDLRPTAVVAAVAPAAID
ncbi:family 78 glycoside hydrolase catalytic domain [Trichococcus flocculiformis]|uniref:alpha-L-rhamnosidase n=1 Tax=Trichococcus flocculiformis TaxID=82803 RepID=UPI003DA1FE93